MKRKTLRYRGEQYVTCEELIGFLHEYLSGEAPPERAREFERHLSICSSCVAYLNTYREAMRLGRETLRRDVPEEPPPPELVRAILAARR